MSSGNSKEHRLLRYYLDCVEVEGRKELVLRSTERGTRFILIESGPESLLSRDEGDWRLIARDEDLVPWATRQQMALRSERLLYGYPIISGEREGSRVYAPLFFSEIELRTEGNNLLARPANALIETSLFALDLLGLDREERGTVLEELEALEAPDARNRLTAKLALLSDMGLLPEKAISSLEFEELEAVTEELIANTAMVFAGERALMTRQLLDDLAELEGFEDRDLRGGPLGILLGASDVDPPPSAEPQPSILPTNLSQDRAITSALQRTFTVVTGPPGTGKSQVLVNAVAAALERGESVLFASKNNKAVDVVFERLAAVSAEAAPLRVGAARLRGNAAQAIRSALSRSTSTSSSLTAARGDWAGVAAALAPLYDVERERVRLERELHSRERLHASAVEGLRPSLLLIEDPVTTEQALEALSESLSRLARPLRFPLFKTRRRAARQRLFDSRWAELTASLPDVLRSEIEAPDKRMEPAATIEELKRACEAANRARAVSAKRLELDSLPDRWELQEHIREKDKRRLQAGRHLFEANWIARIRRAEGANRAAASAFADGLDRLARGDGGSAWRLRSTVRDVIPTFPVWGVTNLSARTNLPLESGLFDLVIIDEASQCDIPSAIPLLFRAKRALVIGDRHQLIHVSTLAAAQDERLAKHHALSDTDILWMGYRLNSLFGLSSRRVDEDPIFLEEHYRSHRAIITFSNDLFYGSRLIVLTEQRDTNGDRAVRWVNVNGTFRRGPRGRSVVNIEEVHVMREVIKDFGLLDDHLAVGIVTPYRAQVEALRSGLQHFAPPGTLTIDTAHRFQGDERDVIFFCPTVSPTMPARFSRFANDPNLVNVAITRARRQLVIVGDREACREIGGVLGHLATYVTGLEDERFESPIERRLFEALDAAGIRSEPGYQANGYRLDLAVIQDGVKLDIECDGAAFHRERRADAIRDAKLREEGWRVMRFTGREINQELDRCVNAVRQALTQDPS